MKRFGTVFLPRIILATFFSTLTIMSCGDSGPSSQGSDGGYIYPNGGTTIISGSGGATVQQATSPCAIYNGDACDPSRYQCDSGYECLMIASRNTTASSSGLWGNYYFCVPNECQNCNKPCAMTYVSEGNIKINPNIECEFSFCDGTNTGSGGNTTPSGSGGQTSVVTPPKVNCDSYSFRGCSDIGSITFSSNCNRVGCNFKKTNCKTSGDISSTTTCDCVCY